MLYFLRTGWNGDANQTVDIEHITESTCYQIVAGSGKANYVVIDCEGGDTPENPNPGTGLTYSVIVPAGTKACYIAGEMNEWTQTAMTKVDETHYTITYDNATSSMKYKYCSGPSWDYVEMQADGVTDIQDRTYATYDIVAKWKAVYDPNLIYPKLHENGTNANFHSNPTSALFEREQVSKNHR